MNWIVLIWLASFSTIGLSQARVFKRTKDLQKLFKSLKRRSILSSDESILGVPESVEDLPEAEPVHPGHTLLQPSLGMLKSAVKYPQREIVAPVYGNLDNLGITYGRTNERLLYTNFRKSNDLLVKLLVQAIQNIQEQNRLKRNSSVLVIKIDPAEVGMQSSDNRLKVFSSDIENNASEILDESVNSENMDGIATRRKRHRKKSKFRSRDTTDDSSSSGRSSSSLSSDYERNPGNPYTIHKDKYKQNWMWNQFMSGDHMNVNPYAPQFSQAGPSGASLFFGRKWWYFNQDDYKPLS